MAISRTLARAMGGELVADAIPGRGATFILSLDLARCAEAAEDSAERVFVVLYEVSGADEAALDRWDGAELGYYRKFRVRVSTLDGEVVAWLYVLNDYEGGLPSARYLGEIADAAESAGAPHDYVMELRKRPC